MTDPTAMLISAHAHKIAQDLGFRFSRLIMEDALRTARKEGRTMVTAYDILHAVEEFDINDIDEERDDD